MDLVFKRYASPFPLIDNLIQTQQFNEWVEHLLNKNRDEEDEKMLWDFFLHKVFSQESFVEWKANLSKGIKPGQGQQNGVMDEAQKDKIIRESQEILKGMI